MTRILTNGVPARSWVRSLFHLAVLSCSTTALAQGASAGAGQPERARPGTPPATANRFSVGAALIVAESPYVDVNPRFLPVPFLNYQSPRFQITGLRASYSFIQEPSYSMAAVAQWRFAPFQEDDSPMLEGLHNRDPGLEAGVRLSSPRFLPLETALEIRGDTWGKHDGLATALDLGWRIRTQQGFFRPSVRLEWQSQELAEYLYGVSPEEARPDRPAYRPDGALHCGVDAIYARSFAGHWEWTCTVGVNLLDSEATDSPLVEHTATWRSLLGIGYRF